MAKAIVGLDPLQQERSFWGKVISVGQSRSALESGIFLVPEDRHGEGLVLGMNVRRKM